MVGKAELLAWVKTLDDESCIGIDEGGLTLYEVLPDDTTGEAYFEIGGLPEDDPLARSEYEAEEEVETNPGPYRLLAAEVPYLPGCDPTSKGLDS